MPNAARSVRSFQSSEAGRSAYSVLTLGTDSSTTLAPVSFTLSAIALNTGANTEAGTYVYGAACVYDVAATSNPLVAAPSTSVRPSSTDTNDATDQKSTRLNSSQLCNT